MYGPDVSPLRCLQSNHMVLGEELTGDEELDAILTRMFRFFPPPCCASLAEFPGTYRGGRKRWLREAFEVGDAGLQLQPRYTSVRADARTLVVLRVCRLGDSLFLCYAPLTCFLGSVPTKNAGWRIIHSFFMTCLFF